MVKKLQLATHHTERGKFLPLLLHETNLEVIFYPQTKHEMSENQKLFIPPYIYFPP